MPKKTISDFISVSHLPENIINGQTYLIDQPNPNTYTHIFFKYPCRFIPEVPRWAINNYLSENNYIVFDPFAGSGTTLLEGILSGHESFGTEIDLIAKLIIKVKTTPLSHKQLQFLNNRVEYLIDRVKTGDVTPTVPQIKNLNHWFNSENINYLSKIRTLIDETEDQDVKDFLSLCFVSIIKKVSNADDISPKPYVSSKIHKEPPCALAEFVQTYKKYYEAIYQFSQLNTSKKATIIDGDALNIKFDKKIDLAITSPPYINAFDYARTMRLENLWLGTMTEDQIRNKKKEYVGTESIKIAHEEKNLEIINENELLQKYYNAIYPNDKRRALIVKKFFEDMRTNLIEISNILNKDSHFVIVIGNSNIRGVEIESWKVLEQIAHKIGFSTSLYYNYIIQNPYIRIPRNNRGGKINKDHVLVLKK